MKINDIYKTKLKEISNAYIKVHESINDLENQMIEIIDRKNELSSDLISLRESELNLINKLEEDYGIPITQEMISEILKH